MKRTYKYALTVVLGLGMAIPALAQDGFPDVKDTHWAADSVNRLKLTGLIHGDNDGNFNGTRTMTRYEVASIVYAVYAKLVGFNDATEKNLKALEARINSIKVPEGQAAPDVSDIKTAIADLQRDMGSMKSWGNDLVQLKRMASTYSNELKSLGADVDDMKRKISDLSSRIKRLEDTASKVKISGDASFWMAAASNSGASTGVVNQDGKYLQGHGGGAGIDTLAVFHEMGLRIESNDENIPVKAEFVVGNTWGANGGFGNQIYNAGNLGTAYDSTNTSVYVNELTANLKSWNLKAGRQGMRLNKFILQRPDTTSFYSNSRWDDKTYRMDGATIAFGPDDAGKIFIGTTSNVFDTSGFNVQPVQLNTLGVNRMMGATYDIKFGGDKGSLGLSYVDFDGSIGLNVFPLTTRGFLPPPNAVGISRQNVYGADLSYNFGGFMLEAGGGKSVGYGNAPEQGGGGENQSLTGSASHNLDTLIDSANGRWNVSLGTKTDTYSLKAGYRNVEQNYVAPGDWGRVSIFRNLVDTKALSISGMLKLSSALGIHGWYEKGDAITGVGSYKSWKAGLGYKLTSRWGVDAMYEDTKFDGGFQGLANGASSKFTTVNLGYDLGDSTMFKIFWQNSDLNNVMTTNPSLGTAQKGSFYGAQFSVKF